MIISLRFCVVMIGLIMILVICNYIRKNKLSMRYAFLWLVLSVILLVMALIPGMLDGLASFMGFEVTSNMIFFIAIFILLIISLSLSMIVSEQSKKITLLVQEVSILKQQLHTDTR